MKNKSIYILANFGGPRSLNEVEPFLIELLTDREVIRNSWPNFFHRLFFTWVAKRRSKKVIPEYQSLGGCSPIYNDTEKMAEIMSKTFQPIFTFHRYLPATHHSFVKEITKDERNQIKIFPLFPQFSYSTTGSIALWFKKNLPSKVTEKMVWIKSYGKHPAFIEAHRKLIEQFIIQNNLKKEETTLLFSAHGLPQKFVDTGDTYQQECQTSFELIMEQLPHLKGILSYQSRFGREEWIKPYTIDICKNIRSLALGRRNIVFVPLSFTSDHIETLCEIEKEYMPEIREHGLKAFRIPCLNFFPEWIQAIHIIMNESEWHPNDKLVRKK